MTFDLAHFRAEFTRRMAIVTAYMTEIDSAAAELRRRVATFPVAAS